MSPKETYSPANKVMSLVLKSARIKAELTNEELALKSGVPYGTVVKLMSNRTKIDTDHLTSLAPALNRTPADLMREAVEDLGGMDRLIRDAQERAARAGVTVPPVSGARSTNVTPLYRKRNDQLTAEEIDAGNEDRAANEPDPESDEPEDL